MHLSGTCRITVKILIFFILVIGVKIDIYDVCNFQIGSIASCSNQLTVSWHASVENSCAPFVDAVILPGAAQTHTS